MQAEKDDLADSIALVSRDVKLKDLILQRYIPEQFLEIIKRNAAYDERDGQWHIAEAGMAGNILRAHRDMAHAQAAHLAAAAAPPGGPFQAVSYVHASCIILSLTTCTMRRSCACSWPFH